MVKLWFCQLFLYTFSNPNNPEPLKLFGKKQFSHQHAQALKPCRQGWTEFYIDSFHCQLRPLTLRYRAVNILRRPVYKLRLFPFHITSQTGSVFLRLGEQMVPVRERSRSTCAFSFKQKRANLRKATRRRKLWLCSGCCCDGEVPKTLLDSQHWNSCSSTKVPALDCKRDLRGRCYISICSCSAPRQHKTWLRQPARRKCIQD